MPRASDKRKPSVQDAIGLVHLLAVGVSDYDPSSNFPKLRQCNHDAAAVAARFTGRPELLGAADRVVLLTSEGKDKPTKGRIIGAARALASKAGPEDRLVLYFSGHGHRIGDELYLVPEDAYADDVADALILFDAIATTLSNSQAKIKVAILDACYTGPNLATLKHPAAKLSEKFLAEHIGKSKGVVTMASSLQEQSSSTKSPDPNLSLFTHFLVKALDGTPEALDDGLLTVQSVFDYVSVSVQRVSTSHHRFQQPTLSATSSGMLVLGDYRATNRAGSAINGAIPHSRLVLRHDERGPIRSLGGFEKGRHSVPTGHTPFASSFVKKIGEAEVKTALKEAFPRIKEELSLKQRDLELFDVEGGVGSIRAPGFIYGVMIDQNPADESQYLLTRSLDNATTIGAQDFEELFATEFNTVEVRLDEPDVSGVIAELEDQNHTPKCAADGSRFTLPIPSLAVTVSVDEHSLLVRHKSAKPPAELVRVFEELLASAEFGPALAIAVAPKPPPQPPRRVPAAPVAMKPSPAQVPPPVPPFRYQVASVGNVFSGRTNTLAQRVLAKADAATESSTPTSARSIRVFPASSPDLLVAPDQMRDRVQSIEIGLGKSPKYPLSFSNTSSAPYTEGRSWAIPAGTPRRDFVVGNDGSTLYREGLWEETFPRGQVGLRGDEFGGCSTFELMFKAVRYMQRWLANFSKPVERYELILELSGIQKKRLLCDPAELGALRTEPLIATTTSSEPNFTVGATFVRELTEAELVSMCTELLLQVANIFDASNMVAPIVRQAKLNLGVS
jgi:hypothetical protein